MPKKPAKFGDVDLWVAKPLRQLEHETTSLFPEEWRVFAVLMRCSLAPPCCTKQAVRRRYKGGTFEEWAADLRARVTGKAERLAFDDVMHSEEADLDDEGRPLPLRYVDICTILGWPPRHHGNVLRAIRKVRRRGLVREQFPFTIEVDPKTIPPPENGISTDTIPNSSSPQLIKIIGFVLEFDGISTDTIAEAVRWALEERTRYLTELNQLRNEVNTRIREGCTQRGIHISSRENYKSKKEGRQGPPHAAVSSTSPEPSTATAQSNPTTGPTTALVPVNPDEARKRELFNEFRTVMKGAGRPITVAIEESTWALFRAESMVDCERILNDARLRAEQIWRNDKLGFVPDPVRYLKKRPWDLEPIGPRMGAPTAAESRRADRKRQEDELFTNKVLEELANRRETES